VRPAKGKERKLNVAFADATAKDVRYSNGAEVLGLGNAWALTLPANGAAQATWLLDTPVELATGDTYDRDHRTRRRRSVPPRPEPAGRLRHRSHSPMTTSGRPSAKARPTRASKGGWRQPTCAPCNPRARTTTS